MSQDEVLQLIRYAEGLVARSPRAARGHLERLIAQSRSATMPQLDPGALVVDETLSMIGNAYEYGWQPLDLLHAVRRQSSAAASTWLANAVMVEASRSEAAERAPRQWNDQLAQVRGSVGPELHRSLLVARNGDKSEGELLAEWATALSALAVMHEMPRLERLVSPPSTWDDRVVTQSRPTSSPAGNKILARVRALLAKAESTTYPAEAEAFTAKAQDLMTRHSIDDALVRAAEGVETQVDTVRILIESPYAKEKAVLLSVVAGANRTRAVWNDWASLVTLVGESSDLEQVEMLFTSTLVQATRAMTTAGADSSSNDRSTSFRKAFLTAYATRIGERLTAAAQGAERSYGEQLLPVLARQHEAVDRAVSHLFPHVRTGSRRQYFDARGWDAGTNAANEAVLPAGQVEA